MKDINIQFFRKALLQENEDLPGDKEKIDVADPKGKITKADFEKLRAEKGMNKEGEVKLSLEQKIVDKFIKKLANEFGYSTKDAARFVKDTISKMGLDEEQMKEETDEETAARRKKWDDENNASWLKWQERHNDISPTPELEKDIKAKKSMSESGDHEVSMAKNSLKSIISSASQLMNLLGQDEKDIPAWIQDHITNTENFINQAAKNYHEYSPEDNIDTSVDSIEELQEFITSLKKK